MAFLVYRCASCKGYHPVGGRCEPGEARWLEPPAHARVVEGGSARDMTPERFGGLPVTYRANFGDGTWTSPMDDVRDARLAIWGRAAIVQHRSFLEYREGTGEWERYDTRAR